MHRDGIDTRHGRSFVAKPFQKLPQAIGIAFDLEGDSVSVVADETGELMIMGQAENEGTKADTLHDAAYLNGLPLAHSEGQI